jgi:hypothetical protein
MKVLLFIVLLIILMQAGPKNVDPEVNRIEGYCADIEAMMSRSMSSVRIFTDVSDKSKNEPERWREFITEDERQATSSQRKFPATAYVVIRNGRPVAADFMFEGDPSRWTVGYCFREDGTLARVDAAITLESRDISISKMQFFSTTGKTIFETNRYYDNLRKQQTAEPSNFNPPSIHIYRTIKELPFYNMF